MPPRVPNASTSRPVVARAQRVGLAHAVDDAVARADLERGARRAGRRPSRRGRRRSPPRPSAGGRASTTCRDRLWIRFRPTVFVPAALPRSRPLAGDVAGLARPLRPRPSGRSHADYVPCQRRAKALDHLLVPVRRRLAVCSRASASASRSSPRSSASSSPGAAPLRSSASIRSSRARTRASSMRSTLAGARNERPQRLRHECVTIRSLRGLGQPRRRAQPEQHVVERAHELGPSPCRSVSTSERRTASSARDEAGSPAASARSAAWIARRSSLCFAEQDGGAQLPGLAEEAGQRPAQLLGAKRLVLEEGELPAVERLGERRSASASASRVSSSRASSARNESSRVASPGGCVAAIGSTGRIPNGRQSSRSNSTGPAATGAAGREPDRRDGVGELGGRVGRRPRRPRARARARARSSGRPRDRSPAAADPAPPASGARARRSPRRAAGSRRRARPG